MTRVFITGDTHGQIDWRKLNTKQFPIQSELTKDDFVIVTGDFGGVWDGSGSDKYILNTYDERNFTTLFVDGNHENHAMLDAMPVEEFNGGKVHRVSERVIHLMRGQVYEFGRKTFFTFGGARSTDRDRRIEDVSWWAREMPSEDELREAEENLSRVGYSVDYVVTHECPKRALADLGLIYLYTPDKLNIFFDYLTEDKKLQFRAWYFGHYHEDRHVDRWHLLYDSIEEMHL